MNISMFFELYYIYMIYRSWIIVLQFSPCVQVEKILSGQQCVLSTNRLGYAKFMHVVILRVFHPIIVSAFSFSCS